MTSQEQFVCCCEALLIAGEALHDQIQDSGRGPVRRALATIPALQGHPESSTLAGGTKTSHDIGLKVQELESTTEIKEMSLCQYFKQSLGGT
jgi:hypothetical protein